MAEDFRFFLNMQIIADGLYPSFPGMTFHPGEDVQELKTVSFFIEDTGFRSDNVSIVAAGELTGKEPPSGHCALIILGTPPDVWDNGQNSIICVPEKTDSRILMNACQEIFLENHIFASNLRNIAMQDGTVDELCEEGYRYFHNPLFVHDSSYNIISCPVMHTEMIPWEYDPKSGLMITPLDHMNELRTDREYQETLPTRGAHIFSANLRGHRDLYVNIWNRYGIYEGRLVICELETPFTKGQFAAAEYLAKLVLLTMAKRRNVDKSNKRAMDAMLLGMLQGKSYADDEISSLIRQYDWKIDDRYICICMDAEERTGIIGSAASVCNQVEGKIAGSKAVTINGSLCIIVNLAICPDYSSELIYILRDGLFKAGFGRPFPDLRRLEQYYRQACIALEYCKRKNGMMWYYHFDDIAVDYIADQCSADLLPEVVCADEIRKLRDFDAENHTDLYRTLKAYILNERNTTAASAELYIGRSTLFYRLRKIREITGLDADRMSDPARNLYLRLSIYLLERAGQ